MQNQFDCKEFIKSQIAALVSTTLDYVTVIGLTQVVGLWYLYSNIVGASLGAISNFFLGRKWAFKADAEPIFQQSVKYISVAIGSLVLNTFGLYALTEWGNLHYIVSKIVVGISVAIGFNFVLQKYFVFRKSTPNKN